MSRRSYRISARHKVWLEAGKQFALGDGGVVLLRAIEATGSIRAAAEHVGWSYRHALRYLGNAERTLGYRLVERTRGGNARGGALLTRRGERFLRRYTEFRGRLDSALRALYRSAFGKGTP